MSIALASERRSLAQDEFDPIIRSHYLVAETLSRIARGKAEALGTAAERASERGLAAKKQVFANALKRVNARITALEESERRALALTRLRTAVARKQAIAPQHPQPGRTVRTGMRVRTGETHRRVVQAARIGQVSQSVRNAQAARDGGAG